MAKRAASSGSRKSAVDADEGGLLPGAGAAEAPTQPARQAKAEGAARSSTRAARGADKPASAAAEPAPRTKASYPLVAIITGKDSFLRQCATDELRRTIEAGVGATDLLRFDGDRADLAQVLDECRTFGLIGGHKIILVDDAEDFTSKHREALERYAANPSDAATLVLRAETWRPGNLDKAVAKVGVVRKCESPSPDEAAQWATQWADDAGAAFDRGAAELLSQRSGDDMGRLFSEVGKLALAACGGASGGGSASGGGRAGAAKKVLITRDLVSSMVPPGREEHAWTIQESLLVSGAPGALRQLDELLDVSRQPVILVRAALIDLARKLHGASRLSQARMNDFAIGKTLAIWPADRAKRVLTAARQSTPDRLADLLHAAIDADQKAKSGQGDERRGLEALILAFARALAA